MKEYWVYRVKFVCERQDDEERHMFFFELRSTDGLVSRAEGLPALARTLRKKVKIECQRTGLHFTPLYDIEQDLDQRPRRCFALTLPEQNEFWEEFAKTEVQNFLEQISRIP